MKSEPVRLQRKEPKKVFIIPTIDRVIFYAILMILFALFIVSISVVFGYNSMYYYNSPLIHGGM